MTDFDSICEILGKFYSDYKEDEGSSSFKDFIEFNDLGVPLAYFVSEKLCKVSDDGKKYITETWRLFLKFLDLKDTGFEDLNEMFLNSPLAAASGESNNEDDTAEIEEVPYEEQHLIDIEINKKNMTQIRIDSFLLAGYFTVDSGQAMVGDPAYLDEWDTNENDEWNLDGKEGQYSYHGASATTVPNSYGELGHAKAVVFSTGRGDGMYPVYVEIDEDDKVSKVLIDFMGDIELEGQSD